MPTYKEQILAYLATHLEGADDDQLSLNLGITPRQTVNAICNQLAREGRIIRQHDIAVGKIVNRLSGVESVPKPAATPPIAAIPGSMIELPNEEATLQFAYAGEHCITEDMVTLAVKGMLEQHGWLVSVKLGHTQGIDIDACREGKRVILESKGEGTRPAMRVNFFLGALGELLQRMESSDAHYGLALPAHRQYVRLILRLPLWVRVHLQLRFYLVRPTVQGLEVGYIPPTSVIGERP